MSSGFYSNAFLNNADLNPEWGNADNLNLDSSTYLYDSPQLDDRTLAFPSGPGEEQDVQDAALSYTTRTGREKQLPSRQASSSHIAVPQHSTSHPSPISEDSSRNSSSPSAFKQAVLSASSPPKPVNGNKRFSQKAQLSAIKTEEGLASIHTGDGLAGAEESMFPTFDANMNMDMDNLSLQSGANFDFSSVAVHNPLAPDVFTGSSDEFAGTGFGPSNLQGAFGSPVSATVSSYDLASSLTVCSLGPFSRARPLL